MGSANHRLIAAISAALLFAESAFGTVARSGFWSERRTPPVKAATLSLPAPAPHAAPFSSPPVPRSDSPLAAALESVPASACRISKVHHAAEGAPLVLLIQDIHLDPGAQKNSAAAISALAAAGHISFVAAEGAFGAFDFMRFRRFSDAGLNRLCADRFLHAGLISGVSYAGITSPSPIRALGVDDPTLYALNVSALRDASAFRPKAEEEADADMECLRRRKARDLSRRLAALDEVIDGFRSGSIGLGRYAEELATQAARVPPPVLRFVEALRAERSLDFHAVERDQRSALAALSATLSPPELSSLADDSLAFRAGRMEAETFWTRFSALCASNGVTAGRFPHLKQYIDYVSRAARIDGAELYSALESLERDVIRDLARTPEERELIAAGERAALRRRMARFELTYDDWRRLRTADGPASSSTFSPFERFYDAADRRSAAMAARVSALAHRHGSGAFVMGGFHSADVARRLAEAGISYAILTPRIVRSQRTGAAAYLSVFDREKRPIERQLAGERLFLLPLFTHAGAPLRPGSLPDDLTARAREIAAALGLMQAIEHAAHRPGAALPSGYRVTATSNGGMRASDGDYSTEAVHDPISHTRVGRISPLPRELRATFWILMIAGGSLISTSPGPAVLVLAIALTAVLMALELGQLTLAAFGLAGPIPSAAVEPPARLFGFNDVRVDAPGPGEAPVAYFEVRHQAGRRYLVLNPRLAALLNSRANPLLRAIAVAGLYATGVAGHEAAHGIGIAEQPSVPTEFTVTTLTQALPAGVGASLGAVAAVLSGGSVAAMIAAALAGAVVSLTVSSTALGLFHFDYIEAAFADLRTRAGAAASTAVILREALARAGSQVSANITSPRLRLVFDAALSSLSSPGRRAFDAFSGLIAELVRNPLTGPLMADEMRRSLAVLKASSDEPALARALGHLRVWAAAPATSRLVTPDHIGAAVEHVSRTGAVGQAASDALIDWLQTAPAGSRKRMRFEEHRINRLIGMLAHPREIRDRAGRILAHVAQHPFAGDAWSIDTTSALMAHLEDPDPEVRSSALVVLHAAVLGLRDDTDAGVRFDSSHFRGVIALLRRIDEAPTDEERFAWRRTVARASNIFFINPNLVAISIDQVAMQRLATASVPAPYGRSASVADAENMLADAVRLKPRAMTAFALRDIVAALAVLDDHFARRRAAGGPASDDERVLESAGWAAVAMLGRILSLSDIGPLIRGLTASRPSSLIRPSRPRTSLAVTFLAAAVLLRSPGAIHSGEIAVCLRTIVRERHRAPFFGEIYDRSVSILFSQAADSPVSGLNAADGLAILSSILRFLQKDLPHPPMAMFERVFDGLEARAGLLNTIMFAASGSNARAPEIRRLLRRLRAAAGVFRLLDGFDHRADRWLLNPAGELILALALKQIEEAIPPINERLRHLKDGIPPAALVRDQRNRIQVVRGDIVLMLPFWRRLFAYLFGAGRAVRWLNSLPGRAGAIPILESPFLPGLAMLAAGFLGSPFWGSLIGGLIFTLMHYTERADRRHLARTFPARLAASFFISWLSISTAGWFGQGPWLTFVVAIAAHSIWNAVIPRRWRLSLAPDPEARYESAIESLRQAEPSVDEARRSLEIIHDLLVEGDIRADHTDLGLIVSYLAHLDSEVANLAMQVVRQAAQSDPQDEVFGSAHVGRIIDLYDEIARRTRKPTERRLVRWRLLTSLTDVITRAPRLAGLINGRELAIFVSVFRSKPELSEELISALDHLFGALRAANYQPDAMRRFTAEIVSTLRLYGSRMSSTPSMRKSLYQLLEAGLVMVDAGVPTLTADDISTIIESCQLRLSIPSDAVGDMLSLLIFAAERPGLAGVFGPRHTAMLMRVLALADDRNVLKPVHRRLADRLVQRLAADTPAVRRMAEVDVQTLAPSLSAKSVLVRRLTARMVMMVFQLAPENVGSAGSQALVRRFAAETDESVRMHIDRLVGRISQGFMTFPAMLQMLQSILSVYQGFPDGAFIEHEEIPGFGAVRLGPREHPSLRLPLSDPAADLQLRRIERLIFVLGTSLVLFATGQIPSGALPKMLALRLETLLLKIARARGGRALAKELPGAGGLFSFLINETDRQLARAVTMANEYMALFDRPGLRLRFYRDSSGVALIPVVEEPAETPPNISAGTMTEADHEVLDARLGEFFDAQRAHLVSTEVELTEAESDRALVAAGHVSPREITRLRALRARIRESIEYRRAVRSGGRQIAIYFPVPPGGRTLFWAGKRYAAGHRNRASSRIHIALPVALETDMGAAVGRHELIHILEDRHETSLDARLARLAQRDARIAIIARLVSAHVRVSELGDEDAAAPAGAETALMEEARLAFNEEHYVWVHDRDPTAAVRFAAGVRRSLTGPDGAAPRIIFIAGGPAARALKRAVLGWPESVVATRTSRSTLRDVARRWGAKKPDGHFDGTAKRRFLLMVGAEVPDAFLNGTDEAGWTVVLLNRALRRLALPAGAIGQWRRLRAVLASA